MKIRVFTYRAVNHVRFIFMLIVEEGDICFH